MSGRLYLCGTPIGNLSDFSPRAVETLRSVDLIAAEDTRHSLKLLRHFEISKPMVSYFEHNKRERGEQLMQKLLAGENIALITDAGMPAISDPGEDLVRLCHEHGIPVSPIPGPCAAVSALAAGGLPTGRFCFEGFLTVNKKGRREHLESLRGEERTMIFYEAPHKLTATLGDMLRILGDRRLALAREMTKLHEEIVNTTLSQALAHYEETPPKGEFVLILEGCGKQEQTFAQSPAERLEELISSGVPKKDAIRQVASERQLPKREVYALTLAREEEGN